MRAMTSSMTSTALSRPSTMWARSLRLVEPVLGAPADDLDLVVDVGLQRLHQVERAGDAVDEGHRVHGEVRLQRRVLVEVVEDDEPGRVLLELDDEARLAAGRLVVDVADALDGRVCTSSAMRAAVTEMDVWYGISVTTIWSPPRPLALLDLAHRPQADGALAGAVGVDDPLPAHDQRAGGEVGALHELHEVVGGGLGVVDQVDGGVDDLAEVVRRDVGGHADRDALAAVDEQVREPGRQHLGLGVVAGVVVVEVDGVLVDAVEHPHGELAQPRLGVARGGRAEVRARRSCRARRRAGGGGRSPGPCGRGRRRSPPRRGGGTCP